MAVKKAMTSMIRSSFVVLYILVVPFVGAEGLSAQRDPNILAKAIADDEGSLAGVIKTPDGEPIARAHVLVTGADLQLVRTVVADNAGSYVFSDLPAGRYAIVASSPGYVDAQFGQEMPSQLGTPIQLANRQKLDHLDITLLKGGVITGTLVNEHGNPATGIHVLAMRVDTSSGDRQLIGLGDEKVDDRGVYRIYGLPPGNYVVTAVPPANLNALTETLQRFAQFNAGSAAIASSFRNWPGSESMATQGRAGGRGVNQTFLMPPTSPASDDKQHFDYARAYFPGTPSVTAATTIALRAGEERAGIDFRLDLVPTAKLEGSVVAETSLRGVSLQLIPQENREVGSEAGSTTSVSSDGTFTFASVVPGRYTIEARAYDAANGSTTNTLWGELPVTVDGQIQRDLMVMMQQSMTITGQINTDPSASGPSMNMGPLRVSLSQRGGQVDVRAVIDGTGRFTIHGVVPGRYALDVNGAGGWFAKSAITGGQDALDFGLQVRTGDAPGDLLITMTNRVTQVSGRLLDATGRPTANYTVIVFATEAEYWLARARRIQAVRPATDGSFSIRGLPPGDYMIAAIAGIDVGQWYDPLLLKQLKAAAIPLHLADGDQKTQDFRVGSGAERMRQLSDPIRPRVDGGGRLRVPATR